MRRMEDRIRKLCSEILAASDEGELAPKAVELREVLHDHIERLRGGLASYPYVVERRARKGVLPTAIPTPMEKNDRATSKPTSKKLR